ncbi:hypothetical protein NUH30_15505 [Leptospira sp. 85282-16]|uniref:Uncharacterized protein n=1 Tax=Leptospira montravelensis TaxID=2484961 RepID=A0ABY2LTT5_9LEPT|nr:MULTISPECIES: hypothetical protein [Leptospira]MCT8335085.1 hypothetical protein [Leptospira sp. 85282-16]TGK78667.1 hypothetical protein EHQ19_16390 [Leptospira montravelensis]TGL02371.1 hypothetical protein EHQ31_09340 [Leptospira montravelensis]
MNIGGIGGNKNESGLHEIIIISVSRSKVEDPYFYQSILKLIEVSQKYVETQINEKSEVLKKALDNNDIQLSTNELNFTPIPSNKSPRELWGL